MWSLPRNKSHENRSNRRIGDLRLAINDERSIPRYVTSNGALALNNNVTRLNAISA
jgi:hypothetical protein